MFRFYECRLTVEEAAELCFKSVITVKKWDKGQPILKECRRLMRMIKGRELHYSDKWSQFEMIGDKLKIPTGRTVTPNEILIGIALIESEIEIEMKTSSYLLKTARKIADYTN